MKEQYLLTYDAGTGAGRCLLINPDGQQIHTRYEEWTFIPDPGAGAMGIKFDPDQFFHILGSLSRAIIKELGIKADQIAGVSSTSMREGCVFFDKAGQEIYAGPNRDFRGAVEGMQISTSHGMEMYRRTGHHPTGIFLPERLLWHKKHAPEIYDRVAHILMINDWILYRLTGEYACEPSNASETLLYDLTTGKWALDIIDDLGFPKEAFPPILPSGSYLGDVTPEAARATGLLAGTPVYIGGADTQCGVLGSGAVHVGETVAVSGTSTPVQMVTDAPIIDEKERLWAGAHVFPGLYVLESNAGGTGSIYQWYRDAFCQSEIETARKEQRSAYDVMNDAAQTAPPGAGGMQSFMGVSIFNSKTLGMPKNVINTSNAPFYFPGSASKGLVTRAILESLAFAIKANYDQLEEVSELNPEALHVCGGSTKSALYLDILANVMNKPLLVPEVSEATSVGAAICAGVGSGVFADFNQGISSLVNLKKFEPEEELSKQYKSIFRKWMRSRESLQQTSL
jgi:autoinducer 2 (AI-2) kinase